MGCAGTNEDVTKKVCKNKNLFFSASKTDGYNFLKMYGLVLKNLDSVKEGSEKVYIFYYR
jgi:hypothetical protein